MTHEEAVKVAVAIGPVHDGCATCVRRVCEALSLLMPEHTWALGEHWYLDQVILVDGVKVVVPVGD